MRDQGNLTAEDRALKRAKDSTDVMWHVAVYAIVNMQYFVYIYSKYCI